MERQNIAVKMEKFFSRYKPSFYNKRQLLLCANDIPSYIFYIKTGYVRVYRLSEQGAELTLTILKPDDFFPMTYGLNQTTNQYYLETLTPLTLVKVPQDQFLMFIKSHPDILFELTSKMLIRFDSVLSLVEYLVISNAYMKVVAALVVLMKRFGEHLEDMIRIPLPLTHQDIATFTGLTRETTSHEMKKLERKGFITKNGKYILIKKTTELENLLIPYQNRDNVAILSQA